VAAAVVVVRMFFGFFWQANYHQRLLLPSVLAGLAALLKVLLHQGIRGLTAETAHLVRI
jgi:hypothetical protein